jgi:PmbA protein
VDLEPLRLAAREFRHGGCALRDFRFHASDVARMSLGVKDAHAGSPHAPLSIKQGAGVRYLLVWDDGRVSRGYLERGQVERQPVQALEDAHGAAYDDPDAAHVLGPTPLPEVELHDAATASMAQGDTTWLAARLATVRARVLAEGVRTFSASFSFAEGHERVLTSAGLDATERSTSASWHVTLNGEAGAGHASRRAEPPAEFDARLERLFETARELGRPAAPAPGGVLPVLLHPRVVEEYALATLLWNLSGETVAHGEGRFRREDFGSPGSFLREDLSLAVDPLLPLRGGSYRFSGEGVPAMRSGFVESGRLVEPVLDLKYSRRLGRSPTGLPLASDTVLFEGPPPLPLPSGLALAQGGVLVLGVLGVHTQDSASGDFSLSVPQALQIGENGLAGKVRGTISGNLFDVLRSESLRLVTFEGEHTAGWLLWCRMDRS